MTSEDVRVEATSKCRDLPFADDVDLDMRSARYHNFDTIPGKSCYVNWLARLRRAERKARANEREKYLGQWTIWLRGGLRLHGEMSLNISSSAHFFRGHCKPFCAWFLSDWRRFFRLRFWQALLIHFWWRARTRAAERPRRYHSKMTPIKGEKRARKTSY